MTYNEIITYTSLFIAFMVSIFALGFGVGAKVERDSKRRKK